MNNRTNNNGTNNSTNNNSPSSKRATKKFFLFAGVLTATIAIVVALTEVLGFLIETFTSIPLLFKVTLGACYFIALVLMIIFCKKHKFIVLLLWTIIAIGIYLAYAIFQFPGEFISNLYFPEEFAGGYFLGFVVAIFTYIFAFDVFKKKK